MKNKLIEAIKDVPIAGKTYEEYVEAVAEKLIDEDYRKASDVAEEIFAEIDDIFLMFKPQYFADAPHLNYKRLTDLFAKLKKKYTVTDTDVSTNTEEGKWKI